MIRTEKDQAILEEFKKHEIGVDIEFSQLPNAVQEIALKKISIATDKTDLVRHLDRCEELRDLTKTKPFDHVKEVDCIMRYYDYLKDNGHV